MLKLSLATLLLVANLQTSAWADAGACNEIREPEKKNLCMGLEQKDTFYCNKLSNMENRNYCVSKVREYNHHQLHGYIPITIVLR
jgi:hypothetical protein